MQRRDDPSLIVADHTVLVGVDAGRGQLLADPRAVRVDDLAEQELGSDRENLTPHFVRPFAQVSTRCQSV